MSSDAPILPLKEIKDKTEGINHHRAARSTRHSINEFLLQHIFQIASGYKAANDGDELRNDPIIKIVWDRVQEADDPLASQPTMTRFENAVSRTLLYRLQESLLIISSLAMTRSEPIV